MDSPTPLTISPSKTDRLSSTARSFLPSIHTVTVTLAALSAIAILPPQRRLQRLIEWQHHLLPLEDQHICAIPPPPPGLGLPLRRADPPRPVRSASDIAQSVLAAKPRRVCRCAWSILENGCSSIIFEKLDVQASREGHFHVEGRSSNTVLAGPAAPS